MVDLRFDQNQLLPIRTFHNTPGVVSSVSNPNRLRFETEEIKLIVDFVF